MRAGDEADQEQLALAGEQGRTFEKAVQRMVHEEARGVEVSAGEVTLTGEVVDRRTKRLAEDVAESVMGVFDVHNRLRIVDRQRREGQARRENLREGMRVLGKNGEQLGQIRQIRDNDFILDRADGRNVVVPFSAVHTTNGEARLNAPAGEIENQGWRTAEKAGGQATGRR